MYDKCYIPYVVQLIRNLGTAFSNKTGSPNRPTRAGGLTGQPASRLSGPEAGVHPFEIAIDAVIVSILVMVVKSINDANEAGRRQDGGREYEGRWLTEDQYYVVNRFATSVTW